MAIPCQNTIFQKTRKGGVLRFFQKSITFGVFKNLTQKSPVKIYSCASKNGKSLKIFDYSSPPTGGGGPLLGEAQKRTKSLRKLLVREENRRSEK